MAILNSFLQRDFSGGMNTNDNASSLESNEYSYALNNRIDQRGIVKKRPGYTPIISEVSTATISGLVSYFGSSTIDQHLLRCNNGAWEEYDGSTFNTAFTTSSSKDSYHINFNAPSTADITSATNIIKSATINTVIVAGAYTTADLQDKILYITSGDSINENKIIATNEQDSSADSEITIYGKWDNIPSVGSSVEIREVTPQAMIYNGSDTPFKVRTLSSTTSDRTDLPAIPNLEFTYVYHNRIWGFEKNSSKLLFSDLGNFQSWPKNNYIDVDKGDGQVLKSISETSIGLAVYKNKKTFLITGNTTDNYGVSIRDRKHGCLAPRTTQSYKGICLTLEQDGVFAFTGQDNVLISDKISNLLDTDISLMTDAQAHVFKDKYYLSYPSEIISTGNDRQLVYDFEFKTWAGIDTYGMKHYVRYGSHIHGVEYDNVEIHKLEDDSFSDDGATIGWQVDTKEWDLESLGRKKKNKFLFVECKALTTSTLMYVRAEVDNEGYTLVDKIDLGQAGSTWDVSLWDVNNWGGADNIIERLRVGQKGRNIKYRFTNNSTNQTELYKYESAYKPKKIK